jgi:hypothetical protein
VLSFPDCMFRLRSAERYGYFAFTNGARNICARDPGSLT